MCTLVQMARDLESVIVVSKCDQTLGSPRDTAGSLCYCQRTTILVVATMTTFS